MRSLLLLLVVCLLFPAPTAFAQGQITPNQVPTRSFDPTQKMMPATGDVGPIEYSRKGPDLPPPIGLGPPLLKPPIECFDFDENPIYNGGFYFIPPDPHVGVGTNHVINIGNTLIEWRLKAVPPHTQQHIESLESFFSALPGPPPAAGTTLGTFTFDPKVIYDQYANRWVVVTLEQWNTLNGDPSNESRILVAISRTSDPNSGWWLHSIDSRISISGTDHWADYPGLAVDDKAVYITNNMFSFAAGAFGGVRLWIIDKAPTYAGPDNSISVTVYNPYAGGGFSLTTQPSHMWGAIPLGSTGLPLGTYLVGYSGLSDGVSEYLQIVEVTDPLGGGGGPFFVQQFLIGGDIEGPVFFGLPDAPQLGSATAIEVNDRRALNAVWRDNCLYTCATILPENAGQDPANVLETTAHWWRVSTVVPPPGLAIVDEGNVGGNDIAADTYTFFPSVMVDCGKNMAIGFSASAGTIYCGAYYASRLSTDAAGAIGPSCTLQAGLDTYVRTFSGTRNRWGDYSGLALCPVNESEFWVYNEYACVQGTLLGGELGRWCTKLGCFRIKDQPTAITDPPVLADYLGVNYPNPFQPLTTITYGISEPTHVLLRVYDASGRVVRTLVNRFETPDTDGIEVTWRGENDMGKSVASGVYFYKLVTKGFSETRKMVLLK